MKKKIIDRKEFFKNAKFLAVWLALALMLYYAIPALAGWERIEGMTAAGAEKVLKGFGVTNVKVNFEREPVLMNVEGVKIGISELCTGLLETLLLATAIIASFGIHWKKRIIGAVAALAFGLAFNQFRIFVSIMQILNTDLQTAELTHDVFFRLSILIVIAGFYYWWFRKATASQSTKTSKA